MIIEWKEAEALKQHLKQHFKNQHQYQIILTKRDEIPIEKLLELNETDCPVKKCLEELKRKGFESVFYRKERKKWALALKPD